MAGLSHGEPLLAQGLTTVVINPDGGGPVDLAQQRRELIRDDLGVNTAQLVPHGSIRSVVLGAEDRAPTATEMEEMRSLVRNGMEEGAYGLSSGMFYVPGSYSDAVLHHKAVAVIPAAGRQPYETLAGLS